MSTINYGRWYVPQTTIGKILLAGYILSTLMVMVPLYGIAFNQPRLLGPFPEAITWSYIWYGVINLNLIALYVFLFKPWADQATKYAEGNEFLSAEERQEPAGDEVVTEEVSD